MADLENNIRSNKEAFNTKEPSESHFDNFRNKLDDLHSEKAGSWISRYGFALRTAAVILIFITLGTLFYTGSLDRVKDLIVITDKKSGSNRRFGK